MESSMKKNLQKIACKVRMGVIEGTYNARSGHPGGSLSISELLTYLYFGKMRIDPENPENPDRDRFVLSKGHTAPALYAVLALKGYFPFEELKTLRHIGSDLLHKGRRYVKRFTRTGYFCGGRYGSCGEN